MKLNLSLLFFLKILSESYAQQNCAACLLMFCQMKNCCEHILKETIN